MNRLPLSTLGAVERDGSVTFGLFLPWVSANDGYRLEVRVVHEADRFLRSGEPQRFEMQHELQAPYGDYWSVTVPIRGTSRPGSSWGKPGRYVYRYCLRHPQHGEIDGISDPFAREFGLGNVSAFTFGYEPYEWSSSEDFWQVPALSDLVLYELNVAEFAGDLPRTLEMLSYLQDLKINAIEVMPLSNVPGSVDWGYLPIGYFGVDERFGKRSDFQRFVDAAHQHGIAVIVDAVYGHTGVTFPYYYVYNRLGYRENPFMGPFAKDYFSDFGKSTDFGRELTRDYFFSVNTHWLDVYHIDGVRYDCVPNYWDGPLGVGYANLVYETHEYTKAKLDQAERYWTRFRSDDGVLRLVQCAEQLEGPQEILRSTYSNCTWQNTTLDAARAVARGDRGRLEQLGLELGLFGYPDSASNNGSKIAKTALQYLENHDHERFICNFGLANPDEAQNLLFLEGDRRRWYKLQPFLMALLLSKGIPMLWQGQEVGENYFLPDFGYGRVGVLRPIRWDFFHDEPGTQLLSLVRKLLGLRSAHTHLRTGEYFFFNQWERYQSKNLLLFARYSGPSYTLVALNMGDEEQTVPFWFPQAGSYREELHPEFGLQNVGALQETWLRIPSNYGRIWTHA